MVCRYGNVSVHNRLVKSMYYLGSKTTRALTAASYPKALSLIGNLRHLLASDLSQSNVQAFFTHGFISEPVLHLTLET